MPAGPILSRSDLEIFDPLSGGRRWLCPLCGQEKPKDAGHRSLSLDPHSGLWKCFRCGAAGKLKDQWEERPGSREVRARKRLDRVFAVPEPPIAPLEVSPTLPAPAPSRELLLLAGTPGEGYLRGRGIDLAVAEAAGIRFAPNWHGQAAVVFTLHDAEGNAVARQGRFIAGKRRPSAITEGPKKHGIFSTHLPVGPRWWNVSLCLILTEAPIDALSLAQVYYPALAFCGTSGPDWLHVLGGLQTVFLAFDADEAGDKAAATVGTELERFGARCFRLRPEGAKDWNEMLLTRGRRGLGEFLEAEVLGRL